MGFFYAAMWFIVGLVLMFSLTKENKIFYLAGGFFLLLGGWWLADTLLPDMDLFSGGWGIALRVIAAVVLAVLVLAFVREHRRGAKEDTAGKKPEDGKK